MSKYKLILMSFDGEYVTERPLFDTVDDAWEYENDLGSKWFFYPFPFVVTESGLTIVGCPEDMGCFYGKRVATVEKLFKKVQAMPETEGMDVYAYMYFLLDYCFSGGKSNEG
jgi:hypothetical protein